MRYKLTTRTTTGALQWEFDFTMPSDRMAIDFATRQCPNFAGVQWFMGIDLWAEDRHVAFICLKGEPQVRVVLDRVEASA